MDKMKINTINKTNNIMPIYTHQHYHISIFEDVIWIIPFIIKIDRLLNYCTKIVFTVKGSHNKLSIL